MLEASDLAAGYAGKTLFSGVSFTLEPGEVVALRGPSGSGKSTLLRCLAGLSERRAGEVRYRGKTPRELGIRAFRRLVAYVPQSPPPLLGTGHAFLQRVCALSVHAKEPRADLRATTERALAISQSWQLPDAAWQQEFLRLSGGERQRLYLALVLATEPQVLLLDEPTSALDAASRDRVEATLRGRTALWITHDDKQAARVSGTTLELGPKGVRS